MDTGRDYIAGPMTGYRNYNWPEFERMLGHRRAEGFNAVSPTEIDEEMGVVTVTRYKNGRIKAVETTPAFDYEKVLARDLQEVERCTRIVLLRGWNRSTGARRELAHALKHGLQVILEEEAYG